MDPTTVSQDNRIKQRRAWLLLGRMIAERSCPCKQPACPAVGGGPDVTFKPLVPRLSVRESLLALTSPVPDILMSNDMSRPRERDYPATQQGSLLAVSEVLASLNKGVPPPADFDWSWLPLHPGDMTLGLVP
ncbi:hypothetical protein J6590_082672 [Homalodisca vitripennis]|nr:hypothetical protein J6590_082672 [Homalodisca vitripennis]